MTADPLPAFLAWPSETARQIAAADWVAAGFLPPAEWPAALQGVVGTVVRRDRRDQFVAVVRFLGRGATVELRDWQVERIED